MPLTPVQRKAELLLAGVQMKDIAAALECSPNHVSMVVSGIRRSPRTEAAIAKAIKKPLKDVFPPAPVRLRQSA